MRRMRRMVSGPPSGDPAPAAACAPRPPQPPLLTGFFELAGTGTRYPVPGAGAAAPRAGRPGSFRQTETNRRRGRRGATGGRRGATSRAYPPTRERLGFLPREIATTSAHTARWTSPAPGRTRTPPPNLLQHRQHRQVTDSDDDDDDNGRANGAVPAATPAAVPSYPSQPPTPPLPPAGLGRSPSPETAAAAFEAVTPAVVTIEAATAAAAAAAAVAAAATPAAADPVTPTHQATSAPAATPTQSSAAPPAPHPPPPPTQLHAGLLCCAWGCGQWRQRWRELPQAGCPGLLCCAGVCGQWWRRWRELPRAGCPGLLLLGLGLRATAAVVV